MKEKGNMASGSMGERLIDARNKIGLQQKEAAESLGVAKTQLNRYEKQSEKYRPSTSIIVRMAQLYGTSADYLLGLTPYSNSEKQGELAEDKNKIIAELSALPESWQETMLGTLSNLCALQRAKSMSGLIRETTLQDVFSSINEIMLGMIKADGEVMEYITLSGDKHAGMMYAWEIRALKNLLDGQEQHDEAFKSLIKHARIFYSNMSEAMKETLVNVPDEASEE